jgi:putative RecB family exonuclease
VVSYRPDEDDLRATERLVEALWRAIDDAQRSGEWLPNPGAACRWCSFQEHCPAFGNEPPPLPERAQLIEVMVSSERLAGFELSPAAGAAPPTGPPQSGP